MAEPVYIEDYEELFVDIQSQRILVDQKTFVDSEPKITVKEILDEYRRKKEMDGFSLKHFFESHFEAPQESRLQVQIGTDDSAEEHIHRLWDVLTRYPEESRGTLMPLPEKFVVPGGRFREIFYWDSYFTMLGLQVSKRWDLIGDMVKNFACLIDRFGFIPNGNRTYFLSRSQPPFFSFMVEMLAEEKGERVLLEYLPQLEKEYAFWMKGADKLSPDHRAERHVVLMRDGEILNRYWDSSNTPRPEGYMADLATAKKAGNVNPEIFRDLRAGAESGWDFSSRWFADGANLHSIRTTSLVPVDLNCLLLQLERSLEKAWRLSLDHCESQKYYQRARHREMAIQKYLWNEEDKQFSDFEFLSNKPTRVATIGMVYPLVLKIATYKQVARMVVQLTTDFLQPGGLLSTQVNSGEQWDAPNGWAPMQWMAYIGVRNYGYDAFAETICRNWMENIDHNFRLHGKLMEKYNVVDIGLSASGGEYPNQDGFGWTNGVYLKFRSIC